MIQRNLQNKEIEIIKLMASTSLNVNRVAKMTNYHRNSVMYNIKKIKTKTGLDACNFYDLIKLNKIVDKLEKEQGGNEKI